MRVLGENVQDKGCAVEDFHVRIVEGAFQLALLSRRQLLVEDHHLCARICSQSNQLLKAAYHAQTCRVGQSLQFKERVL